LVSYSLNLQECKESKSTKKYKCYSKSNDDFSYSLLLCGKVSIFPDDIRWLNSFLKQKRSAKKFRVIISQSFRLSFPVNFAFNLTGSFKTFLCFKGNERTNRSRKLDTFILSKFFNFSIDSSNFLKCTR